MGFEDFHFLRPAWLLAVPLLAWLAWFWVRRTQSGSGWEAAIDSPLLGVLLEGRHSSRNRALSLLLVAALSLASVGLAGPTWQKLPQNVEQRQDALIILLDLSLSMLAEDVKPSRVERARQEIADVLRMRHEGQTALIAYAGDAHAVVPLTDDTATIENLLFSLSPEMMPVFGSNPDHALILARELFENAGILQGRVLLLTDGIDAISSVSRHRSAAYPISIIGIGTPNGAEVPLDRLRQPGRFLQTQEGNRVIAQLDEARLAEVAELGYGYYARAEVGDADITTALATALPSEDETIEVEREFDTWFDQGHWVSVVLIPLMLLAFRKGVLVCVVAAVMIPAPPAHAAGLLDTWASLWQRPDQRGFDKLRHGAPEQAAALFRDPEWQSVAHYRSGEYAQALDGFRASDSVAGLYNQGNSLARLGEYQAAIDRYDAALAREPGHEDAAFNKALVERLLEEQQQAEQQQNQDQQNQANNQNSDTPQDQQQQEQDRSDQEQQEDQSEQQENAESQQDQEQQGEQQETAQAEQDDAGRDEKQDALEQWLRRVPDDPGGLMRRKFSHETKQRLRRGEYENREGDKIW